MITAIRSLFLVTGIVALAHYVPAGFWLLAERPQRAPAVHYSCVENRFLFYRFDGSGVTYTDTEGRSYERTDFERLLPFLNWVQLSRDGRLPDEVAGVAVTPQAIRGAQVSLRLKPDALDTPLVRLIPLFEAESGRVRLEEPKDFMRLGATVEFIDAATNSLDTNKSARFAQAFSAADFVFPAGAFGSNPSTRKPYDEGCFIADATGALFRLRQVRGEPELQHVADLVPEEDRERLAAVDPLHVHVAEQDNREIHALVIDRNGRAFLLVGEDWRLVELPLQHFEPASMQLTLRGDLLHRTVTVVGDDHLESIALDRDYALVDRYTEVLPRRDDTTAGRLARVLFPLTLDFEDATSGYLRFGFAARSGAAFAIAGVLATGLALWWTARKRLSWRRLPDLAAVAVGGLAGLALVLLLPRSE